MDQHVGFCLDTGDEFEIVVLSHLHGAPGFFLEFHLNRVLSFWILKSAWTNMLDLLGRACPIWSCSTFPLTWCTLFLPWIPSQLWLAFPTVRKSAWINMLDFCWGARDLSEIVVLSCLLDARWQILARFIFDPGMRKCDGHSLALTHFSAPIHVLVHVGCVDLGLAVIVLSLHGYFWQCQAKSCYPKAKQFRSQFALVWWTLGCLLGNTPIWLWFFCAFSRLWWGIWVICKFCARTLKTGGKNGLEIWTKIWSRKRKQKAPQCSPLFDTCLFIGSHRSLNREQIFCKIITWGPCRPPNLRITSPMGGVAFINGPFLRIDFFHNLRFRNSQIPTMIAQWICPPLPGVFHT